MYNPVKPECHRCPLHTKLKDCIVPPEGSTSALIALVGEGPGNVEERYHRPFIGPAGQELKWLLEQAGMPPRERMFITNAAMCKPQPVQTYDDYGNESLYMPYRTVLERSTLDTCRARLHSELALVKPRVVLAVGNYALQSLTGQRGILKRHGAIIPATVYGVDARTVPVEHRTLVVPLLHPAALLRNPKDTYGVIEVLKRVQRIAETGNVTPDHTYGARHCISPYHAAGPDGALDILEDAVDRAIREKQEIAVDVETTSELPRTAAMTIFGFATYREAFAVTIVAWNKQRQCFEACWTPAQATRRDVIIRRLLHANLPKWAWNYSFDKTVCERAYGTDDNWHDGLHWAWLIQPELDHHLNFTAQMWLDIPPWKVEFWDKQNAGEADHDDLSLYNCDDCRYTIHIVPHLRQKAAERGVQDLVEHQMRVSELARRAELYGIPVHRKSALELREKHAKQLDVLLQQMRDAVRGHEQSFQDSVYRQRYRDAKDRARKSGKFNQPDYQQLTADDFNPNSPYHARWFLYEFLRLKTGRWTGGGAEKDEAAKRLSTSYKGILNYLADPKVGKLVRAYVDHSEEDYRVKHLIDPVLRKAEDDPDHPDWARLFVAWNTCFDALTEVLTEEGFVPFPEAVRRIDELRFAQYEPDSEAVSWTYASNPITRDADNLVAIAAEQVDLCVTSDHHLLLRERARATRKKVRVCYPADIAPGWRFVHAAKSGQTIGKAPSWLTADVLRLLVACQADGHWDGSSWRFEFNRRRKFTRLRQLADAIAMPYTFTDRGDTWTRTEKRTTRYYLRFYQCAEIAQIFSLLKKRRMFGGWLLSLPHDLKRVFIEELQYWDGHAWSKTAWSYFSPYAENAMWAQVVACLCGFRAHVRPHRTAGWRLNISSTAMSNVTQKASPKPVEGKQPVFCVSVPSSFLVVRRAGKTLIAGNCGMKGTRWTSKLINMQNFQKPMRRILRAKPGRVWVGADAAAIEYRIAAALAGLEELITLFNKEPFDEEHEPWKKFDGNYDAHSLVAEEVYQEQYKAQAQEFAQCTQWLMRTTGHDAPTVLRWKAGEVPEQARAVWKRAKAAKKLLDNWRTMVKRVVYALFYGARPAKILVTIQEDRRVPIELRAALTEDRIAKIWDGFKRRFPEWDRWAYREMDLAVSRGYQTFPPFDRKRYWTQKEVEENKIRNTPIQLAAGDVCNIIFCNVQDHIDAEGLDSLMTIHGHDAGIFDTAEEHAERVRDIYNEAFHLDLPGPAGNVHIYGQATIGPTVADVG